MIPGTPCLLLLGGPPQGGGRAIGQSRHYGGLPSIHVRGILAAGCELPRVNPPVKSHGSLQDDEDSRYRTPAKESKGQKEQVWTEEGCEHQEPRLHRSPRAHPTA